MKETNLEKAKRLYPIGTNYKSPYSDDIGTLVGIHESIGSGIYGRAKREDNTYKNLYICYNGNWAEIISYPEPQVINDYQIY